jgi:hypothetical protein
MGCKNDSATNPDRRVELVHQWSELGIKLVRPSATQGHVTDRDMFVRLGIELDDITAVEVGVPLRSAEGHTISRIRLNGSPPHGGYEASDMTDHELLLPVSSASTAAPLSDGTCPRVPTVAG